MRKHYSQLSGLLLIVVFIIIIDEIAILIFLAFGISINLTGFLAPSFKISEVSITYEKYFTGFDLNYTSLDLVTFIGVALTVSVAGSSLFYAIVNKENTAKDVYLSMSIVWLSIGLSLVFAFVFFDIVLFGFVKEKYANDIAVIFSFFLFFPALSTAIFYLSIHAGRLAWSFFNKLNKTGSGFVFTNNFLMITACLIIAVVVMSAGSQLVEYWVLYVNSGIQIKTTNYQVVWNVICGLSVMPLTSLVALFIAYQCYTFTYLGFRYTWINLGGYKVQEIGEFQLLVMFWSAVFFSETVMAYALFFILIYLNNF